MPLAVELHLPEDRHDSQQGITNKEFYVIDLLP